MRVYKQVHRDLRLWGCEEDEDEDVLLKVRRYEQVKHIEYVDYF